MAMIFDKEELKVIRWCLKSEIEAFENRVKLDKSKNITTHPPVLIHLAALRRAMKKCK